MTQSQALWIMAVVSALLLAGGYAIGYETAQADMLASCKGEERGIYLSVGNKRYFYFCSYVQP